VMDGHLIIVWSNFLADYLSLHFFFLNLGAVCGWLRPDTATMGISYFTLNDLHNLLTT